MGWISKRAMKGNPVGGYNAASPKNNAPLRKIVQVLRPSTNLFDASRVLLECGHETNSNGAYRARCVKCKTAAEAEGA